MKRIFLTMHVQMIWFQWYMKVHDNLILNLPLSNPWSIFMPDSKIYGLFLMHQQFWNNWNPVSNKVKTNIYNNVHRVEYTLKILISRTPTVTLFNYFNNSSDNCCKTVIHQPKSKMIGKHDFSLQPKVVMGNNRVKKSKTEGFVSQNYFMLIII